MPSAFDGIEYRRIDSAEPAEVIALFEAAGWWEPDYRPDFIAPMLSGSFAVIGAFAGGRLIGVGRAVSDGASDAYLQDVAVDPAFRRRGIGAEIVRRLLAVLQEAGIDWIGLIGAPGTGDFYRALGFREMTGFLPMHFEPGMPEERRS